MSLKGRTTRNVVKEAFGRARGGFVAVGALSCAVNLLMLTGPIFMLQVYDRVLTSRSVPTLVALMALVVGLYAMMGLFDFSRTRVLSRVAHWIDDALSPLAFRSWMIRSLGGQSPGYRPIQDLGTIRGFMASPTILALFDLPWFPIYLAVVFGLHLHLGLLASAGATFVIVIAVLNEWLTGRSVGAAAQADIAENRFADQTQRSADSVLAMGMLGNSIAAWRSLRDRALVSLQFGSERSEIFTTSSKSFRLLLQSAILGLGAYLAIHQEISAGMVVAASIIAGRALAPIDQTIGGWRNIKRSRLARRRLTEYLERDSEISAGDVRLPDPRGAIKLRNVIKYPPSQTPTLNLNRHPILAGIEFDLEPGDGLGVIGPSASGKTTLAKLMVGLWMPDQGSVRIDGATFEQWEPDEIGRHIGYLPQDVTLMSGTIAQNIARFDPEAKHEDIVAAAKMADVHDMVLRFPDGYATDADNAVSPLTGGQKQRIALARALYRKPVLIVLDEPNSNLDAEGDVALSNAISEMRAAGSVVVVMAHRPSAIAAVDRVLMLKDGRMIEFGDKADVLKKVTRAA